MSLSTRTYKDLAFSMFANPMSGDIGKSTGAIPSNVQSLEYSKQILMNEYFNQNLVLIFVHYCLNK